MLEKLGLSSFWGSILFVFQGAVLAQLIPILSYIVIVRLVSPGDFGAFSVWLGVVKLYSILVTLRLEASLVNEPDGYERDMGIALVILTIILMSCLMIPVTVVLYFFAPDSMEVLPSFAWLSLGPCALLFAVDSSLQSWAAADGRYRDLNKIRIVQAAMMTLSQLVLAYFFQSSMSLIAGITFGCFVGIIITLFIWPLRKFSYLNSWSKIRIFWSKHKRFPTYSLPADGVSSFVGQLPILIVGARFGLDVAGQLALALKFMGAPVGLLGRAVQDVFKRHAAIAFAQLGNCAAIYKKTFVVLVPGGAIFVAVTFAIGEEVFALVFGEEWREAGKYAVLLSPLFALGFVASPLSYIVYIVNRQYVDLVWQCTLLLTVTTALLVPAMVQQAMIAYSFGYSLMYVAYVVITYRLSLGGGVFESNRSR